VSESHWIERARTVTDAELAQFRQRICVTGNHIGTAAIGSCSRCGGATSSSSMSLCVSCGTELGVCQFDGRLTGWGSESADDPEGMAVRWLALLMCGYSDERAAAARALPGFALPGFAEAVATVGDAPQAGRAPTRAELIVGFHGNVPEVVAPGATFFGADVVSVDPALRFAVLRPIDARDFQARVRTDPRVAYVELNRQSAELED
jgi:hypothetical protein